jgi:hypothetical protein
MGRQRCYLAPSACQQCGNPPLLGQLLIPGDKWRCITCVAGTLPGKDSVSKSMNQMTEYAQGNREAFELEAEGFKADEPRLKPMVRQSPHRRKSSFMTP